MSLLADQHPDGVIDGLLQHKLNLTLQEYRGMHKQSSRGQLPHNKLIYPETLRYLSLWVLGDATTSSIFKYLFLFRISTEQKVVNGSSYMAYPDVCWHETFIPVEAKALPREGASALVNMLCQLLLPCYGPTALGAVLCCADRHAS